MSHQWDPISHWLHPVELDLSEMKSMVFYGQDNKFKIALEVMVLNTSKILPVGELYHRYGACLQLNLKEYRQDTKNDASVGLCGTN
jgi:hypothetical protein